ncbi:urease accessory protein UreE [Bradyrhizobium sp. RDM12]
MLQAIAVRSSSGRGPEKPLPPLGTAVLQHDERHLRRKAIKLTDGSKLLVDLAEPVVLASGDELLLDNGAVVLVEAADEPLYEIQGRNDAHLAKLAWHIGNRHLPAAVEHGLVVILRDHVIKAMLERLGASVKEIVGPFNPVRGSVVSDAEHCRSPLSHDHAHNHNRHD